jgi:hypothetical protein
MYFIPFSFYKSMAQNFVVQVYEISSLLMFINVHMEVAVHRHHNNGVASSYLWGIVSGTPFHIIICYIS